jgi:hypothetical protein
MYSRDDNGLSLALRRLTGKRKPEIPGYHERLKENQRLFIEEHGEFFEKIAASYKPYFESIHTAELEAELRYAEPHPKKALRIQAWKELCETGGRYVSDGWLARSLKRRKPYVTGKMKSQEHAKPGKKTRLIGDIGVAGSLLGAWLAEALKTAQALEKISYRGGLLVFVKTPDPIVLEEVFANLMSPPCRFYFVFYSDDACFSYWHEGRVYMHNLDISSCDASHTPRLFELLVDLYPSRLQKDIRRVVSQCAAPLRLRSRLTPGQVILRPIGPRLYSGSTLTTPINNIANICIGVSLGDVDVITPECIVPAAERAGYIVTGDAPLHCYAELQFLKHSPVYECYTGRYIPVINFGVFVRASGVCKGDLPGRGNLERRARQFQQALVQGIYAHVSSPTLELLRDRDVVIDRDITRLIEKHYEHRLDRHHESHHFLDEDLFLRYHPDAQDMLDIQEGARARYGQESNFPVFSRVLQLDYNGATRLHPEVVLPPRWSTRRPNRA